MASEPRLSYWDANLFIHYAAKSPQWIETLDALVSEARSGDLKIATSAFSVVEAAFTPKEKQDAVLTPEVERAFAAMFDDFAMVRVVEFDRQIAQAAHDLMRSVLTHGRSLKPGDAIHVATAQVVNANVLYSTDESLTRLCNDFQWCTASAPVATSPMFPGFSGTQGVSSI